jgi:hypothetical protein
MKILEIKGTVVTSLIVLCYKIGLQTDLRAFRQKLSQILRRRHMNAFALTHTHAHSRG